MTAVQNMPASTGAVPSAAELVARARDLHELAAHDPHVVVVNLTRNFGHQLALSAGLTVCSNDLVFILDADLQDPPELLTPMLQLIEEGADVVYGQRRKRAGESDGYLDGPGFQRAMDGMLDAIAGAVRRG